MKLEGQTKTVFGDNDAVSGILHLTNLHYFFSNSGKDVRRPFGRVALKLWDAIWIDNMWKNYPWIIFFIHLRLLYPCHGWNLYSWTSTKTISLSIFVSYINSNIQSTSVAPLVTFDIFQTRRRKSPNLLISGQTRGLLKFLINKLFNFYQFDSFSTKRASAV